MDDWEGGLGVLSFCSVLFCSVYFVLFYCQFLGKEGNGMVCF